MKKIFFPLILSIVMLFSAACATGASNSGPATIHLTDQNFAQASITVNKGSSLTVIDDTATPHTISNGSWSGADAKPAQEKGAPTVSGLQFNGHDTQSIGPFATAGTYHLYCSIHQGMNLTVIVQ
ncbi:hypothetical protein KDA_53890 [Dictyobacter alpinus]|uniref:Blue (type 1) copper domain-containing protein n=1 Tax=Dictyobacter alpinus TaxID=2014873 RepID=A0A402BEW7_9CHLR|nr:plastocyanin/azurin family copper-binding protein [Dictyobacter alpinus]GCE29905.1 hypothetical protein KDA_53890 [Dictyobacter alpinus]